MDDPDVRRRLVVDSPEAKVGDRPSRGGNRRAALLGVHARVGGAPVETHLHRMRVRRAEDHVPDRRRLVVDVADLRLEARMVERCRAEQPDLLLRREQQLDARMPAVFRDDPPGRLQHHGDGRLVVRAEDRPGGVAHDAVVDDRLDRPGRRHGVQVRAEEERCASPVPVRLDARIEIPDRRADRRTRVVLVDVEAQIAKVPHDRVGDRALFPGGARERGELREQIQNVRRDEPILRGAMREERRPGLVRGCGRAPRRRTHERAAPGASGVT